MRYDISIALLASCMALACGRVTLLETEPEPITVDAELERRITAAPRAPADPEPPEPEPTDVPVRIALGAPVGWYSAIVAVVGPDEALADAVQAELPDALVVPLDPSLEPITDWLESAGYPWELPPEWNLDHVCGSWESLETPALDWSRPFVLAIDEPLDAAWGSWWGCAGVGHVRQGLRADDLMITRSVPDTSIWTTPSELVAAISGVEVGPPGYSTVTVVTSASVMEFDGPFSRGDSIDTLIPPGSAVEAVSALDLYGEPLTLEFASSPL